MKRGQVDASDKDVRCVDLTPSDHIALLTDFGLSDWYVGVMKGVILSINPAAVIIDLAHSVPPQDIQAASFVLLASYKYLPAGAIVVVVVDPGVGGERKILCAESAGRRFVFPDNGVLTEVLDREGIVKMVSVENREFFLELVSNTFHGRDIFASVAAHLSLGVEIERLGPATEQWLRIEIPNPETWEDGATAHVRWVDGFGNLITDCSAGLLEELLSKWGGASVDLGARGEAQIVSAYEAVEHNRALAIIGSSGYLEVSIRGDNAAQTLGLGLGDRITVRRP